MDDELLPIGRFARLAGLTVGALRHYADEGVLVPARVDAATRYRRYHRGQLATARAVAALRELELSLPAIRALLEADEPGVRQAVLGAERARLEARTSRLQLALHRLGALATGAHTMKEMFVPTPPAPPELAPEVHRALGVGLFNRCWKLLEIEGRTADQDDELVSTAHASAWHWLQVGNAANRARAQWMCSRVYAVLGRGEPAVHHARRCVAIVDEGGDGLEDWDAAAAAEAMARALATAGDLAGAAEWKTRALAGLGAIADAGDRSVVEGDLATLPV